MFLRAAFISYLEDVRLTAPKWPAPNIKYQQDLGVFVCVFHQQVVNAEFHLEKYHSPQPSNGSRCKVSNHKPIIKRIVKTIKTRARFLRSFG